MRKNRFLLFSFFVISCVLFAFSCAFSGIGVASAHEAQDSFVTTSSTSLPSAFSLFDLSSTSNPLYSALDGVQTADLTPNVGSQNGTNICWTFATNTALETSIYMKAKTDSSFMPEEDLNFSELDIAYTLLKKRGLSATAGGTSDMSVEYLTSEYGPVNESDWESTCFLSSSDADSYAFQRYKTLSESNGVTKSGYSVMDAKIFPSKRSFTGTEEEINASVLALRSSIKEHIYTLGGVMSTIYFDNAYIDGYTFMCDLDIAQNHMITLVGWNDSYQYTKGGTTYTGAYIAQNSHGTSFGKSGFFYIMYDSYRVEDYACGFTDIGYTLQSTREDSSVTTYNSTEGLVFNDLDYENIFVSYEGGLVYSSYISTTNYPYYACNIFRIDDPTALNKIARIKIPCSAQHGQTQSTTFKVYVLNNLPSTITSASNISNVLKNAYNYHKTDVLDASGSSSFTTQLTGYYTIDMGENLIELSGDYFAVVMAIERGGGELFCINNSDREEVSYLDSFISTNSGQSWSSFEYTSGNENRKCILPMMVQTLAQLSEMTYTALDSEEIYSGETYYPQITVTEPTNYKIYYDVNNSGEWTTTRPGFKNAGTYTVAYRIVQTGYLTVIGEVTLHISPKTLTLTPNSGQGKEYKGTDPTLTYTLDGLVSGDNPNFYGAISRESGEAVGEYNIVKGNLLVLNSNYTMSFTTGVKFTISTRTITITPNPASSIYGEEKSGLSFSYSGAVASEMPSFNITLRVVKLDADNSVITESEYIKDVGSYDIICSSLSISNPDTFNPSNYNIVYNYDGCRDKYTITPKTLTVTADSKSKIYEEIDPQFTYTFFGQIDGETPAFTGALSREEGEDVNIYSITQGTILLIDNGTFKAGNYTLSFVEATFTIQNADLVGLYTIDDASFTFDGELHSISVTHDETITAKFMLVDNATSPFNELNSTSSLPAYSNVGTYIIKVQFSATNFNTAVEVASLTISRKEITVTPYLDQSKVYGASDYLTYSYSGNVYGQTPAFNGKLSREVGDDVGEYEISLGTLSLKDNGSFKSSNYVLSFTQGVMFSITKRTLIVTPIDNQGKMYNTQDAELLYSYTGEQYQDEITFVGSLAREEGENAGSYAINIGTLALSSNLTTNYSLELSDTTVYYAIRPQPITIKVDDKSCYYGEIDTEYSYTITQNTIAGYKAGDDLNVTYSCKDDNGEDISNSTLRKSGGYTIRATAENSNYYITIQSGKFYIVYKQYDVTFTSFDRTWTFKYTHFDTIGDIESMVDTNKAGYSFEYWQNEENTYDSSEIASFVVTEETTFEAVYSLVTLHITYELNGGYFNSTAVQTFNAESVLDLVLPLKIGHIFDGFYLNSTFTSRSILSINKDFDTNITLYAKWTPKEYEVTLPEDNQAYTIVPTSSKAIYNANYSFTLRLNYAYDNSDIKVYCTYTANNSNFQVREIYRSLAPVVQGNPRRDTIIAYNIENIQDSDFVIEVTGASLNLYTITFWRIKPDKFDFYKQENIDEYKSETYCERLGVRQVQHGASLSSDDFPELPYRKNYSKTPPEWDTQDLTNIRENTDVYAIYHVDKYTVTFVCDDGSTFVTEFAYGDLYTPKALIEELGLSFMYQIVYDEEIMSTMPVMEEMVIHYHVVDHSIYVVYGIIGVLALIFIYFIVSFVHYKSYLHKRKKYLN